MKTECGRATYSTETRNRIRIPLRSFCSGAEMAPLLPNPPPLSRAARVQLSGASADRRLCRRVFLRHTFSQKLWLCQPFFFLLILGIPVFLIEIVLTSSSHNTDLFKSIWLAPLCKLGNLTLFFFLSWLSDTRLKAKKKTTSEPMKMDGRNLNPPVDPFFLVLFFFCLRLLCLHYTTTPRWFFTLKPIPTGAFLSLSL